jgi:hypothetical protein
MEGMEEAEARWSLSGTGRITERSPEKETIARAFKLSAQEAFENQILTCGGKTKSSDYRAEIERSEQSQILHPSKDQLIILVRAIIVLYCTFPGLNVLDGSMVGIQDRWSRLA